MTLKYDKMIEVNREKSRKKEAVAKKQIRKMLEEGEFITLQALKKRTGFSKSFFHRNKKVRPVLEDARRKQQTPCAGYQDILAIEMQEKLVNLNVMITRLELQIKRLQLREKELVAENKILKQMLKDNEEMQEFSI